MDTQTADNFLADGNAFRDAVAAAISIGRPIAGTMLLAAGAEPVDTITRILPLLDPPVKGKEDVAGFYAVACISRDLILNLIALNSRFELGLDAALDLLAMTHPMVKLALEHGTPGYGTVKPGEAAPRRVVREFVEVHAGGKAE